MNTPADSFEDELRALRPAAPGRQLGAAIAAALEPAPARAPRLVPVSLWLSWCAAAAMAVALLWPERPSSTIPPAAPAADAPRFTPVSSSTTLVSTRDEGVIYLDDGMPARKVRIEYLDTVKLRSTDDSSAVLHVSYPSEEIRLVPVQTF